MSSHFITFRNSGYSSSDRILKQAKDCGFFETAVSFSELDIAPLIGRHRIHFFFRKRNGFGRYIWKPYIILKRLSQIDDGDFLVYSDLGNHIQPPANIRLREYFSNMLAHGKSLGVFEVGERYLASSFVRRKYVEYYLPSFYNNPASQSIAVYAGLILVVKTPESEAVFREWLELCEQFLPGIDLGCRRGELKEFIGQDGDSGFLPLVLTKHKIHMSFQGTEINLYDKNGLQLKHSLSAEEYSKLDWSPLSGQGFTYRRDR